eukprot:SAG31_NODE_6002_length_2218_cov_1.772534_3_plen_148_part_00
MLDLPPCLRQLDSTGTFKGWFWRAADRSSDPPDTKVIFRVANKTLPDDDFVLEFPVEAPIEEADQVLDRLMSGICETLPLHAQVHVEAKHVVFDGGTCFVVDQLPAEPGFVRVKALLGGTHRVRPTGHKTFLPSALEQLFFWHFVQY